MANRGMLVAIGGPTASGKTDFAIAVAQKLGTHILSADSRQFYRELRIGSAAPTVEQLMAVTHHFIADRSVIEPVSAAGFARESGVLLHKLFLQHPIVVAVGGSGLYLKALTNGLSELPEIDPALRISIGNDLATHGPAAMAKKLLHLDANAAVLVALDNPRRVTRAIELIMQTGLPLAHLYKPPASPPFDVVKVAITLPRNELYKRIDSRVDAMLAHGLKDEAAALYERRSLPSLQTVGYREVFDYLDSKTDWPEAVRLIKQNTRHFAKRQTTWFGSTKEGYTTVESVPDIMAMLP